MNIQLCQTECMFHFILLMYFKQNGTSCTNMYVCMYVCMYIYIYIYIYVVDIAGGKEAEAV